MRKKVHNMMEDMKGKIRVFARVRPMLRFETDKGQQLALKVPDELTLAHEWKSQKREYSFDAVFPPEAPQDKVRLRSAGRPSKSAPASRMLPDNVDR